MEGGGGATAGSSGGTAIGGPASQQRMEGGREAVAGNDGGARPRSICDRRHRLCLELWGDNRASLKCKYCLVTFEGGRGATWLRQHLASISGNVKRCQQVPQ